MPSNASNAQEGAVKIDCEIAKMDALNEHLDSLASLGTLESHGAFTLAEGQVWTRLRQALPEGKASLRYLLRWLHARGASTIFIESGKGELKVSAQMRRDANLPHVGRGEELDFSGAEIDLARAVVAAQMLETVTISLEIDTGAQRHRRDFNENSLWQPQSTNGKPSLLANYRIGGKPGILLDEWEQDTRLRFRCSPLGIFWNANLLSGPYGFSDPVLVWRNLRRTERGALPLSVTPPAQALESFQAARHPDVDVVLGMTMTAASEQLVSKTQSLLSPRPKVVRDGSAFQLLRHGELFSLPQAERELAGFTGLIRGVFPLDIQGLQPVWGERLKEVVATLKNEALDMALQLYQHDPPVPTKQAEMVFRGIVSVLLHLLDNQRFTEGHLLAQWLRERIAESQVLADFRTGYTFDKLSSLLAEPAGQPQTSIRWNKQAEARVREQSQSQPAVTEEALLIAARLELRARRDQPVTLSGDMQGRLVQLAYKECSRGAYREAAAVYGMLGLAFAPGRSERLEHLTEAARCGQLVGDARFTDLLAREGKAH